MSHFFKVCAAWIKFSGMGDEPKVFRVIRTEADINSIPEYDILVLDRPLHGEWPVFRSRGSPVAPFTVMLRDGAFYPTLADAPEPLGTILLGVEHHTLHDATEAAKRLNAALGLIREAYNKGDENGKDSVLV